MVVAHIEYTASVRIEYRWSKHSDNMEAYMNRHGWHEAGCGTGYDLGNGNRSYVIFTKKFVDVNAMQNEVQDINDAFND